jgi:external thioesterase TEII
MGMHSFELFQLHFAGGNIHSYQFLKSHLGKVKAIPLELPGRGRRMVEPMVDSCQEAIDDLFAQFVKQHQPNTPFAIYGHSMGALLGLGLVEKMEKAGIHPAFFVATGNAGPGVRCREQLHALPDDAFYAELKRMGGMPAGFWESPELVEFFAPILRGDFRLIEQEEIKLKEKVSTPVHIIMGSDEPESSEVQNWENFCHNVQTSLLEGGHFFIHRHAVELASRIIKLGECLAETPVIS